MILSDFDLFNIQRTSADRKASLVANEQLGTESEPSQALMKSKSSLTLQKLETEAKWVNIDFFARLFAWGHNPIAGFIWSLIVLPCVAVTLFLIIGSVEQYNTHGVSSTIRFHMENDAVPFPTFSFCNVNPFNSNFSLHLLKLANVSLGADDESDTDMYWRMFMEIESYLISTRGHSMTLEDKYQLNADTFDAYFYGGILSSTT